MYVGSGKVKVFITDIVAREVKANISKDVAAAVVAHNSFRKLGRVLQNLTLRGENICGRLDPIAVSSEIHLQFDEYLVRAKIIVIPTGGCNLEPILSDYFNNRSPFSGGDKKAEFPDAISVSALCEYFRNATSVHLVSGDGGVREAAARLGHFDYFNDLMAFLNYISSQDANYDRSLQLITDNSSSLEDGIAAEFTGIPTEVTYHYDDTIEDISVGAVKCGNIQITGLRDGAADISVEATVTFDASISHDDYDNAFFDKEDHQYWFVETREGTISSEEHVVVTASISFRGDGGAEFSIDDLSIEEPKVLRFDPDDFSYSDFDEDE